MKKFIASLVLALLTACPFAGFGQTNLQQDPAYLPIDKLIDLETIRPTVNVNLPRFLLKDALAGLNASNTNSSQRGGLDLADLLKDVKLIRVIVVEGKQTNRPAIEEAMKTLRHEVEKKWTSIVDINDGNSKVGVFVMLDASGETTTGLALLICNDNDLIVGNIVGNVPLSKLFKVASQSGKVPKDLLKMLQGFTPPQKDSSTESSGSSSGNSSSGKVPATDQKPPAEDSSGK